VRRYINRGRAKKSIKKYQSLKNDYWDGYNFSQRKSRQQQNSFDKRANSMRKKLVEIENSIFI